MKPLLQTILLLTLLSPVLRADSVSEPFKPREGTEWVTLTIPSADSTNLPRVLLLGDSITSNYYDSVCRHLQGKAYVVRLATSFFVTDPMLLHQVRSVLAAMKFDVIQFNNGIHGMSHTDEEYSHGLVVLLRTIRDAAPEAKLIWASSTPLSESNHLDQPRHDMPRVKERNRIALDLMTKENIPVDDLYALMMPHADLHVPDGAHWTSQGEDLQGAEVADQVSKLFPSK
jgi:hypothetical protein